VAGGERACYSLWGLSRWIFGYVRQELPQLREDLLEALTDARNQLEVIGSRRSTAQDCEDYLAQFSLDYYEVCKAAVGGHYEGSYFTQNADSTFLTQLAGHHP
jgi:hypothetical protein